MPIDVKVNNNIVDYNYNSIYLEFSVEPGEIDIIIHSNLTSLESMFENNYNIKSIKIQTFDSNITNLQWMFGKSQNLISIDLSEFDISKVTNFYRMFYKCSKLVSIKFGDYKTSSAINMDSMFYECFNLPSVDLSQFDTSNVISLGRLFYECNRLSSLDLKTFEVKNVKIFSFMFGYCYALTSLDLSNFITSEANNTEYMFFCCKLLKSLDLNSFITSKVETMTYMFCNCYSLTNLKIDNFDTSSVNDMSFMFYDCNLLSSLNISNFRGNSVIYTNSMFSGCSSLTSLDFNSFKPTKIKTMENMFYGCFNLISLDLNNFDTTVTTNMNSMFYGCISLIYLNINSFNTKNVSDMANLFRNCFSLTSLNLSNFIVHENTKYQNLFTGISKNLIYCVNDDFYEKIKFDVNNIECAIRDKNCIPDWHITSKKIIKDNGMCVEKCSENYKYEYENKCYSACPKGTTLWDNNNFLCKIYNDEEFNENFKPNTINNDNQNEDNEFYIPTICHSYNFFQHRCTYTKYNSMIEIINKDINEGLMNNEIDNEIIKNKRDIYQMENNIKYQITSSFNQKYNHYDNISVIDLNQCETKLKDIYKIPPNETLIIFKYDYISEEYFIPIVGYDVFHPTTKKLLDLNHCKNIKIDITLPANIRENELYKHNPTDNYYKDKCNSISNNKGVDITLFDRKKNYNDKNLALCLDNCCFIKYNNETKKVLCQCEPQYNSTLITLDKLINKKKLLHNFINIKKYINIDVIKCYKKLLSLAGLKNNIGSYIILSILLIYIIGLILFFIKGYNLLKIKVDKIKLNYKRQYKSKNLIITNNPIKKILIVKGKNNKINSKSFTNSQFLYKRSFQNIKFGNKNKNNKKTDKAYEKYSDTDLNVFVFSIAQKNDKRSYMEYYISLVKTRHPFISSFLHSDDYNSMSIKICLLFFTFSLNLIVNSLFFNDYTMHKIVEDEGIFNFVYNLPITIYSTIISFIISTIITKLALSENSIVDVTKEKKVEKMEQIAKKAKKNLIIKFILFFILSFIFLLCFWFYIGCFCVVYTNTQIYLIKDTLISFALSLIVPFIKYIFACFIRIKSLKKPGQCLYNLSQIFQ